MLDLRRIRENRAEIELQLQRRGGQAALDELLKLDKRRRDPIRTIDALQHERKTAQELVAAAKRQGFQDTGELLASLRTVAERIRELEDELRNVEQGIRSGLLCLPNVPHPSVPDGSTAADNIEVRRWGEPQPREFRKDHLEIGRELNLLDFRRAAKVSGSGFVFYTAKGAQLERALVNFMLDFHTHRHGYREIFPPFLVLPSAMEGTGQLPNLRDDMYYIEQDGLFLIPTAEVPLTNYFAGEVLSSEDLPLKLCGYSACFRREAGSYGRETRGLIRMHQFNKVELVRFCRPEDSYSELEQLVAEVEAVLQALGLVYRVILLCAGDLGFASSKTYDIEVWSPCQQQWLEVSSCSNFEDFQARRANIRFRSKHQGRPEFVHTLNGSGLATPRLMVALLEQFQTPEGMVVIPEALRSYCSFDIIARK
ncbi:MAG: serine--tRNA ligase [Candidatus Kapabacteria bacterium]|nr:serine--tRNA ligase [Candidatus Kapabacteria bacterium]MDW7997766.1 serine--tRNA ligase [Bacteroidota bacterium]